MTITTQQVIDNVLLDTENLFKSSPYIERYYSSMNKYALTCKMKSFVPWGIELFKCKVEGGSFINKLLLNLKLSKYDVVSPGRFGYDAPCWSGDPFSKNNKYVALRVHDNMAPHLYKIIVCDLLNKNMKEIIDSKTTVFNRMWSADAKYLLINNLDNWYVYNFAKDCLVLLGQINEMSKHCYIINDSIVYLSSAKKIYVHSFRTEAITNTLDVADIIKEDAPIYSMCDELNKKVYIGVDAIMKNGKPEALRWYELVLGAS